MGNAERKAVDVFAYCYIPDGVYRGLRLTAASASDLPEFPSFFIPDPRALLSSKHSVFWRCLVKEAWGRRSVMFLEYRYSGRDKDSREVCDVVGLVWGLGCWPDECEELLQEFRSVVGDLERFRADYDGQATELAKPPCEQVIEKAMERKICAARVVKTYRATRLRDEAWRRRKFLESLWKVHELPRDMLYLAAHVARQAVDDQFPGAKSDLSWTWQDDAMMMPEVAQRGVAGEPVVASVGANSHMHDGSHRVTGVGHCKRLSQYQLPNMPEAKEVSSVDKVPLNKAPEDAVACLQADERSIEDRSPSENCSTQDRSEIQGGEDGLTKLAGSSVLKGRIEEECLDASSGQSSLGESTEVGALWKDSSSIEGGGAEFRLLRKTRMRLGQNLGDLLLESSTVVHDCVEELKFCLRTYHQNRITQKGDVSVQEIRDAFLAAVGSMRLSQINLVVLLVSLYRLEAEWLAHSQGRRNEHKYCYLLEFISQAVRVAMAAAESAEDG